MSNQKDDRLKRDSEDISRSLDEFLKQRAAVADAQQQALIQYNLDMVNLGESDENHESSQEQNVSHSHGVEHNIMRHIRHSGVRGDASDEDESNLLPEEHLKSSSTLRRLSQRRKSHTRAEMPTPEEKSHIRVQLFKFLQDSKDEEVELETKFQGAKTEEDPQQYALFLKLYEAQKRNYDTLLDYITLYQPEPFNRAWANDPDYINLLKKFQRRERECGENEGGKGKKKKSKKKVAKK
mmetsp:Transcript_19708/g.19809  ORF Transcript_19708/g.19809 Transcript_19708/m.19809 type:complete len:238 (+) Transcript_19708:156-869(+)|eukprot:CAMPEP_0182436244 /NCGR_PEP_ID=MMETSP1167-20130531/80545_1 /TAXON_ID=2988 /ORGANISM="Mallomonas Sp, Strain CCMP3275" /LENGTH=237 /DNA_ID=CAMNT_0024628217 /DNA_START=105 /DNA_END=818 /DNA_ORIENTATION=-